MFLEVKQAPCAEVPGRLMKMIQTILDYSIQSLVQEPDFEELSESVEEDFRYLFGRAAVHSAIEELFELPYIERTVLCEAFENDSEFKDHINDASYSFRRIPENENKVLSNLCNALYDEVRSGLPAGNKTEFNVRLLQTQFAQTNGALGRVCPVCVRELVFPLGEGEVDHYFPRKKYPALALHPYNLLPICSDCNGVRMKHMKSPFEASDRGPVQMDMPEEELRIWRDFIISGKGGVKSSSLYVMMSWLNWRSSVGIRIPGKNGSKNCEES